MNRIHHFLDELEIRLNHIYDHHGRLVHWFAVRMLLIVSCSILFLFMVTLFSVMNFLIIGVFDFITGLPGWITAALSLLPVSASVYVAYLLIATPRQN